MEKIQAENKNDVNMLEEQNAPNALLIDACSGPNWVSVFC